MNLPPRLKRVMIYQFVAVILNAFLAAGLALALIDWAVPGLQEGGFTNTLLRWFAVLGLTFVGCKWLNNISLLLINMIVYAGDYEAAAQEANTGVDPLAQLPQNFAQTPAPRTELMNFLIVNKPEAPYARYQDADIFEWIDVEDEMGVVRRMQFEGTVDLKRGLPDNLEVGTILLPPGILYKFQPTQ